MAQQSPTVVDLAEIGRVQPKVYEAILKKARNERGYLPGKAGETLEILGKDPATYGQFGDHEDEKARQFTKALNKYSLDLALIVAAGGNRLSSDSAHPPGGNKDLAPFAERLFDSEREMLDALRRIAPGSNEHDLLFDKIAPDIEKAVQRGLSDKSAA